MFPSYVEGFPLGVLEMLAAHLPVVAFDAPGAPMMLPPDWLVPPGDEAGLARALVGLLAERNALERNRRRARTIADGFSWDDIARKTAEAYTRARETLGKRSA
jgi:glycosyltransferase involved in cell wall biosynthesis